MKIALAAGLYPPDIGGPARYAAMIVEGLPRQGIEVVVVPYHSVRTVPKLLRHTVYLWRLWRATRDCDSVYALDPISVGIPALIVAKLRQVPLVVRLGGDYAWEQGVQRFGVTVTLDEYTKRPQAVRWPVRVLAYLQSCVVRSAEAVIVPSHYLAGIVTTWGVHPERLHVIYSAHSVPTTVPSSKEAREKYQVTGPTIVSIARLTPWKGMETLIRLVARRQQRGESVTLLIGGDGPERVRLEELVRTLKIADQVRFLGAVPQHEVFTLVRAGDMFMLDTAYEGLSHQLLEVMALGTPVITTPVGGNPELITDGVEGLLVPVGDVDEYDKALSRILTDEALRTHLVVAAKARAQQFASHDTLPKIAQLLEQVAGTNH